MSEFIKAIGIFYKNELNAIKKSGAQLQPVYEAFSNAWESIRDSMANSCVMVEFVWNFTIPWDY